MLEAPLTRRRPPPAPSLLPGGRRRCVSAVPPFPCPARSTLLRGPSSRSCPPSLCPALARSHGGGWSPVSAGTRPARFAHPRRAPGNQRSRKLTVSALPPMSSDLQTEVNPEVRVTTSARQEGELRLTGSAYGARGCSAGWGHIHVPDGSGFAALGCVTALSLAHTTGKAAATPLPFW